MEERNPAPLDKSFIPYKVSTIQGAAGFRNYPQYALTIVMSIVSASAIKY